MVAELSGDIAGSERERRARSFEANELHRLLGLTIEEARAGFARIRMQTNRITGGQGPGAAGGGIGGSVQGGLLATLVDIAALQAVINSLEPGDQPAGTADLNITYLRPALGDRIYADATILRKGRQLAIIEVSVTDPEGRLCTTSRVIYAFRR